MPLRSGRALFEQTDTMCILCVSSHTNTNTVHHLVSLPICCSRICRASLRLRPSLYKRRGRRINAGACGCAYNSPRLCPRINSASEFLPAGVAHEFDVPSKRSDISGRGTAPTVRQHRGESCGDWPGAACDPIAPKSTQVCVPNAIPSSSAGPSSRYRGDVCDQVLRNAGVRGRLA